MFAYCLNVCLFFADPPDAPTMTEKDRVGATDTAADPAVDSAAVIRERDEAGDAVDDTITACTVTHTAEGTDLPAATNFGLIVEPVQCTRHPGEKKEGEPDLPIQLAEVIERVDTAILPLRNVTPRVNEIGGVGVASTDTPGEPAAVTVDEAAAVADLVAADKAVDTVAETQDGGGNLAATEGVDSAAPIHATADASAAATITMVDKAVPPSGDSAHLERGSADASDSLAETPPDKALQKQTASDSDAASGELGLGVGAELTPVGQMHEFCSRPLRIVIAT